MWQERWKPDPPKVIPSCFNRAPFIAVAYSDEFDVEYDFRQSLDCPHWKPGGNAHIRPKGDGIGGQLFPWSSCDGCKWKPIKV